MADHVDNGGKPASRFIGETKLATMILDQARLKACTMTSRRTSFLPAALAALLLSITPAPAIEVNIGHLETNDDTGINWLFFRCMKETVNAQEMHCSVFQTLVMRKKPLDQIDNEIKQYSGADLLADFNKNLGSSCKPLLENEGKLQQSLRTGLGADGKAINARIVRSGLPMMRAILDVCKKQTKESVDLFYKMMTDQERRSCKVHSDYSQMIFHYNSQTSSWGSQEGPTGPCGTIVIGTLNQDPKNQFWHYVEKTIRTNPKGAVPFNNTTCEAYPEHTMNYTWQTTSTLEGCDWIESMPD